MSRFKIVVPNTETARAAQAALKISPDQLARIGHHMLADPTVPKKMLTVNGVRRPRGFIEPLERPGKPPLYIRGLLPVPGLTHSIFATVPHHDVGLLADHMRWHADELQRLQAAGATVPTHFPVLMRDKDIWGDHAAVLMAVAEAPGPDNSTLRANGSPEAQGTLRDVLRTLLTYYTDPTRPEGEDVILDQTPLRQFTGTTARDLDPLRGDRIQEIALLGREVLSLLITPETINLMGEVADAYRQARAAQQDAHQAA